MQAEPATRGREAVTTATGTRQARTSQARARQPVPERDEWLTVDEVCAELKISRRTFDRWRATGKAPRCKPLPGGTLRIRRSWLDAWLDAPDEDIA